MNEPIDPIKVRQARQGKPVLLILAVSMVLAIIAGWVLWGVIAEETDASMTDASAITLEQPAPEPSATL